MASSTTNSAPSLVAGSMNWDPVRQRLLGGELEQALSQALELRSSIEILHSTEFPLMLSALLPSLTTILTTRTRPSPETASVQHRLRNAVLDIISKFPLNEVLRPHAPHIVAVARDVLTRDYEDNAVLASRIIFDLYKVYRNLPQDDVQPYMDFVVEIYRTLPLAVKQNFSLEALTLPAQSSSSTPKTAPSSQVEPGKDGSPAADAKMDEEQTITTPGKQPGAVQSGVKKEETSASPSGVSLGSTSSPSRQKISLRSNASFRVLTESPLIVMLLFQLYPRFVKTNIPAMIGEMINALALRAPRLEAIVEASEDKAAISGIKRLYYDRYREMIASQAKTLSFLTYLLRGFSSDLKPYEEKIALNVVDLMRNCPRESVSTRKELLVATRHLLNSDFRAGFTAHVDYLLDERILMGSHHRFADHTLLRPLAYTTLSDLVQHFRSKMNIAQVSRVVLIFSRVLHELASGFPVSTQYAAVRTLFSVVDIVHRSKDAPQQQRRPILVRIMRTLVDKLYAIVAQYPSVREPKTSYGGLLDVVQKRTQLSSHGDTIREIQSMVRAIVVNLKTVLNYISAYRSSQDEARGSSSHEIEIVERYIRIIFPAAKILKEKVAHHDEEPGKTSIDQYRDALTYFAASFTKFDAAFLRETFGKNLDHLVEAVAEDNVVMVVPRHLLVCNPTTSYEISSIMLDYLVRRMPELSVQKKDRDVAFLFSSSELDESADSTYDEAEMAFAGPIDSYDRRQRISSALLLLFERILKSLASFHNNERIVRKYLRKIVVLSIRSAMQNTSCWPDANCMLLRYTFRSISAGKFEESYKELLPLIPSVLNGLYRVMCSTSDTVIEHTSIELCLTIPARLSSLLPHLNLLLRVIIPALDSDSGDLVNLGLRTLEFWIDNLNVAFLYPEISKEADILSSLMRSLSRHLRPAPYPYGLLTLRLLGKLGGKNRIFLRDTIQLVDERPVEDDLPLYAKLSTKSFSSNEEQPFLLPIPVRASVRTLKEIATISGLKSVESKHEKAAISWDETPKLWTCDLEGIDFDAYAKSVKCGAKTSQAHAAFRVVVAAKMAFFGEVDNQKKLQDSGRLSFSSPLRQAQGKLICVGMLFYSMIEGAQSPVMDLLSDSVLKLEPGLVAEAFRDFFLEIPDPKLEEAMKVVKCILPSDWMKRYCDQTNFQSYLLRSLSGSCSSGPWGKRIVVTSVVELIMKEQGLDFCRKHHETDLLVAAFGYIKNSPKEISFATAKAGRFFLTVCFRIYGGKSFEAGSNLIHDPLLRSDDPKSDHKEVDSKASSGLPSDEAIRIALQEMVSPEEFVRISARFFLKYFALASRGPSAFSKQIQVIRRSLFSRHLRLLPLCHQIGLIESLSFILKEIPGFFPLSDQHVLNFLSELLKMCSVADGEMSDKSLFGHVVDKNGYCASGQGEGNRFPSHAFALFCRRQACMCINDRVFVFPQETPPGVQLRVAAISLIHSVVEGGSDLFFDSEPSTSIGNIRPHMISLLFRSLVSAPSEAVKVSHDALKKVLSLSSKSTKQDNTTKTQSRLPKDLLQMCIRPVLLNLRDYTRLSIPLLRGLTKLLSLLSSWFNKTLGEKLLDHLQRWAEPQKIIQLGVWNEAEEPMVAAAIVDVFRLLPQASKFVEVLVGTCVKIESVMGEYKVRKPSSPLRESLARYLNKYSQAAVEFFFRNLKQPAYAELFTSILRLHSSGPLRAFVSHKQSSVLLLNICFERPLAIMRAEKSGKVAQGRAALTLHGIGSSNGNADENKPPWPMTRDAHEVQLQGLRILSILLDNESSYFEEHGDIIRAVRLLWRSRGRFLRLQNEEKVHPRFHDESHLMACFLQKYASHIACSNTDAFGDVMFELLCIFLQSPSYDFSGLRNFLQEAPSSLLSRHKQKDFVLKLVKRLGSESNEETKILSIQLLLLPLLTTAQRKNELTSVIDTSTMKNFLRDIILSRGGRPTYSDRLRVEFLQVLSIFVHSCPELLRPDEDKCKTYCQNQLKSEDSTLSSWSLVVMCFGCVQKSFNASEKDIRDIYEAVLRAHQQEGKDLVRAAMDILIPELPALLSPDTLVLIIDHTAQVMIVESNQTQHVAHTCLAILKGKKVFEPHCERFAGMIVGTLNRLGLSSGGPFENKFLAVEMIGLLLEWDDRSPEGKCILSTDEQQIVLNFIVRQLLVLAEPDVKQMKVDQGAQDLSEKLTKLLEKVLQRFSGSIIPQHFEKFSIESNSKSDESILLTSLEIILIANRAKKRIFFEDNKVQVARILTASLSLAKENQKIQKKVLNFSKDAFASSLISDAFALSLEKILLEALQRSSKAPPSSESRRSKSAVRESPAYNFPYLVFCMEVVHIICKKTKTFLNRLEHVLLQVASSLAKDHVSEAIAKQRQGSSNTKTTFTGVLHHTPTKGIMHECLKKESYDRTTSNRTKNSKSQQLSDADRALFLSLAIFEDHDIAFSFTPNRKALFQIIGTILDHSHTVMLLIQATRVVGKWLLTSDGLSPVIVKERNSFLWKLSSFDIRCLPNDVAAQPLIDAIRHFIHSFGSAKLLKGDDFRLVFGRLLVANLLHPNVMTRKDLMYEYLSIAKDEAEGSLNVLWKLLHSDFEGIGNRHLTVIFTEAILNSLTDTENNDLLQSLCILVHGDERLCQDVFELVLPWTWSTLENSVQARLARAMELLLSRSYHSQFLHPGSTFTLDRSTMNTPRSFLNAIAKLRPLPVLDLNLLVSQAEKYNAWFEVISILEVYYQVSPDNSIGQLSVSGMRHCYRQLSEENIWLGLANGSCSLPCSKDALRLDMGGFLNRASDAYLDLIDLVQDPESKINPTEFEMDVWEERWVETQRELCQSEVVAEFANASANYELQLECAWRTQDWAKVKSLCLSSNLLVAGESGNATVKLSETLLAVADGKLSEVENLHAQSAQLCLNSFQLLPQISHGSTVHGSLFHFFHRLVEVRESGQIMVETSTHSDRKTLPDLKNLLNAWRGRLPNDYEKMTQWESILSWRNHMFGAITKNFHWSEPNMLASLHDRPWTAIRLAKTARKQGLRNTSMLLLSRASDKSTMNVLDAFLQLREQITAYLNPASDVERQGGLNLINTTNLSFFDRSQTSELFRLKATFLDSLEKRSKANQAFCHCVQLCPSHSRAWVDWGNLCAVLGAVAEQQAQKAPQAEKAGTYKKVAQYLAQAIGCYLEAIRIDTHEWARLNIAKCLWMLSKDGSPGVLGSTFENRGSLLPSWVWLPWLPQLLSGLCRPEGPGLKQLLTMVARVYPQAIYYGMRAFYLERRDVERAKGPAYAGTNQHMPSVLYAEEMLSLLRRSHASLCAQLETILEELIVKFRPSTEEDFLGTIVALLERVETQVAGLRKAEEESMSQSCWKTLGRIAVKYFRQSDSSQRSDARSKQSADFKEKYRKAFEEDFQVESVERKTEEVPKTIPSLLELLERLRGWREKIRGEVFSSPPSLRLIQVSRALAVYGIGDPPDLWPGSCDPRYAPSRKLQESDFNASDSGSVQSTTSSSAAAARKAAINAANAASAAAKKEGYGGDFGGSASVIEVPGSYTPNSSWADARPTPELHPKLLKFDLSVDLIRRKESLVRRIGMIGDDGVCRRFVLQCSLSYWTRVEERQSQTSFVIDKILRKGIKTSRAHISIKPQPVIPVAQRLRLVYEPDHWTSLERENEVAAARSQKQIDFVDRFNKELQEALSSKSYDDVEDAQRTKDEKENRLRIFRSFLNDSNASPSMLKNQISSFLNSTELLHHFRRTFAKQLAGDCLLQYTFGTAERNPEHVVFLRSSGAMLPNEARILYNSHGYIEREKNHVPFRFTRNLASLIGFPLLEGQFLHTMVLFAEAVDAEKEFLNPIFQLLMRDDLVAFFTKTVAKSDSSTVALEKQLQDRVVKNTNTVQSRFSLCAPYLPAEKMKSQKKDDENQALDHKVRQLVAAAQKDEHLSMMPSTFQGWL